MRGLWTCSGLLNIPGLYPSVPKCQHDLSPSCDNQTYLHMWPSIPWREKLPSATGPHDSVGTISHSASLTPGQPHWGIFFFTWLLFEHMKHGPTSGPLQPLFSWLGVLVLLSAPWIYGFLPAFFWVCSNVPKGRVFLLRPMWWLPWGFPGGADSKEPTCNAGDLIPRLGRSLGEGNGYPL